MSIDFGTDIYEEPLVAKTLLPEDNAEVSPAPPYTARSTSVRTKAKENLSVFIEAARRRTEPLDHVLLHGPPGPGQDHARRASSPPRWESTSASPPAPPLKSPAIWRPCSTNLSENDILFVDEIHRLNRSVEEILYPAMEDYAIDIIIGKGPSANSIRLDLPKFTLIGATTRAGQLSAPLRDRFGVTLRLELYTPEELAQIVTRSAGILDVPIRRGAAPWRSPAARRGTPRIANRMLRRVRDFAQVTAGRRHYHDRWRTRRCRRWRSTSWGWMPVDRRMLRGHHRKLRRRPGGAGNAGRYHRRGVGDAGGCV